MWQKIKCWLGKHIWKSKCDFFKYKKYCNWYRSRRDCSYCIHRKEVCKHCGKVKR